MGNFSTRSLIISKDALPEPIMMPDLKLVKLYLPFASSSSTALREAKCFDNISSLIIPPK